jgi:hypothetical protein
LVLVDTSQGDVTIQLPDLELLGSGNEFVVKKITSDANTVFLEAQSGDPLESTSTPFSMDDPFASLTLRSSDAGWWSTAQYPSGEGGGSGGGSGELAYKDEYVVISDPSIETFSLSVDPHTNGVEAYWNGMRLAEGSSSDYTISGQTVNLNSSIPLQVDDKLAFHYSYGGTGTSSGTGTGTAGRRDYLFATEQPVPEAVGILHYKSDGVMTSSVPLAINREATLSSASLQVNYADISQEFTMEVLVNGTISETLQLTSGSIKVSATDFSTALSVGDDLVLRLVRTSGNARSAFSQSRVTFEMTEV